MPPSRSAPLRATPRGDRTTRCSAGDGLAGAWLNPFFRNESPHLSSELILEALAATRAEWPTLPDLGVFTFIDVPSIRRKRDPGRCYRKAGFVEHGYSKVFGRLILRLDPHLIPEAITAPRLQMALL